MSVWQMAICLIAVKKLGWSMKFYGREEELQELRQIRDSSLESARFTVVTGRRRVGKTELLEKALNDGAFPYLYFLVTERAEKDLCAILQEEAQKVITQPILGSVERFGQLFEIVMAYSVHTPMTLVIDEFQDFDKINSAIFGEMQGVWDRYHGKARLNLVVCGSVNRMMNKIFLDDMQPLYGHDTGRLRIAPFSTGLVKKILRDHNERATNRDLLALWAMSGGVARYVELLMDAGAWTRKKMLNTVFSISSPYIDEGRISLNREFGKEFGVYFSILSAIASGKTSFAEIYNIIGKDIGGQLTRLETYYAFIAKICPAYELLGTRNCRYRIDDCFFRFWFRFIYKYMHLVEQRKFVGLISMVEKDFDSFLGVSLEHYFRTKLLEDDSYTMATNWWDRKGENEIDLVCENEFSGKLDFFEVKLDARRYDESLLKSKVESFLRKHPNKRRRDSRTGLLSVADM